MADMQRLAVGDEGEWVDYLRQTLSAQGYPIDGAGAFDEDLAERVQRFQTEHGLTVDGVVDAQTWAALTPVEPAAETSGEESITIDWEQLPWLSMLLQYEGTEESIKQFLIANNVSADLLAVQE